MRYEISQLPLRIGSKIAVNPLSGCWEWTGSRKRGEGAGSAWWEGRLQPAHRVIYMLLVGPIAPEAHLEHLKSRGCLSAGCCWPHHLSPAAPLPPPAEGASVPHLTAEEIWRFYSKILIGGCGLTWNGVLQNGYGVFEIYRDGKRQRVLAHRLSYKLFYGEDPGALVVRHGCDKPACCTPDCLSSGTQLDNMRDAVERGRIARQPLDDYRRDRDERVRQRIADGRKRCSACGVIKDFAEFTRARGNADGYTSQCKPCTRAQYASVGTPRRPS